MEINEVYNILEDDKDFFLEKKEQFLRCFSISNEVITESSIRTIADKLFLSLFSFDSDKKKDIETLITRLLKYRVDIKPELTNFLMNLANEYLDYCIKNKKSVLNVKAFIYLVNYYISLIDKAYVKFLSKLAKSIEEISKEKTEANKELALAVFERLKNSKETVKVLSYYKEVPIICRTSVEKITDEFVVLSFDNCSIKAFPTGKTVYIKVPFLSKKIKATIVNISPKDSVMALGHFEITELPQEKRKFVRVEPAQTIEIAIIKGNKTIKGKIADISIGGVGVYAVDIQDLNEDDIVKLSFKLPESDTIEITGRVVYIIDMDGMYRIGIEYSLDVIQEEKISDYVINRQFEILREIKSG